MEEIIRRDKILETLRENLPFLRSDFKVAQIGLFGSVVRGQESEASDIDLLVEFSEPIGLFRFVELEEFLSRLLGAKVDLVAKSALKPVIKADILRESVYV